MHQLRGVEVEHFPSFWGRTFIEARLLPVRCWSLILDFPSFSEGLSLRCPSECPDLRGDEDFPSFWKDLH